MMKRILYLILLIAVGTKASAQKFEFSVEATGNLSHYTGNGSAADSYTSKLIGSGVDYSHTNNPYGQHYNYGFAAGVKLKYITKTGFIAGLATGYEALKSKVNINADNYPISGIYSQSTFINPYIYSSIPNGASGTTYLNSSFINISPFVGYRFACKKFSIDVLPGVDFAIARTAKEKGTTISPRGEIDVDYHRKLPNDLRINMAVALNYGRLSINASYARGVRNYYPDDFSSPLYATPNAQEPHHIYSELFRLGVGYRLPKFNLTDIFL